MLGSAMVIGTFAYLDGGTPSVPEEFEAEVLTTGTTHRPSGEFREAAYDTPDIGVCNLSTLQRRAHWKTSDLEGVSKIVATLSFRGRSKPSGNTHPSGWRAKA